MIYWLDVVVSDCLHLVLLLVLMRLWLLDLSMKEDLSSRMAFPRAGTTRRVSEKCQISRISDFHALVIHLSPLLMISMNTKKSQHS
jgi:hypothetical protein